MVPESTPSGEKPFISPTDPYITKAAMSALKHQYPNITLLHPFHRATPSMTHHYSVFVTTAYTPALHKSPSFLLHPLLHPSQNHVALSYVQKA